MSVAAPTFKIEHTRRIVTCESKNLDGIQLTLTPDEAQSIVRLLGPSNWQSLKRYSDERVRVAGVASAGNFERSDAESIVNLYGPLKMALARGAAESGEHQTGVHDE